MKVGQTRGRLYQTTLSVTEPTQVRANQRINRTPSCIHLDGGPIGVVTIGDSGSPATTALSEEVNHLVLVCPQPLTRCGHRHQFSHVAIS